MTGRTIILAALAAILAAGNAARPARAQLPDSVNIREWCDTGVSPEKQRRCVLRQTRLRKEAKQDSIRNTPEHRARMDSIKAKREADRAERRARLKARQDERFARRAEDRARRDAEAAARAARRHTASKARTRPAQSACEIETFTHIGMPGWVWVKNGRVRDILVLTGDALEAHRLRQQLDFRRTLYGSDTQTVCIG